MAIDKALSGCGTWERAKGNDIKFIPESLKNCEINKELGIMLCKAEPTMKKVIRLSVMGIPTKKEIEECIKHPEVKEMYGDDSRDFCASPHDILALHNEIVSETNIIERIKKAKNLNEVKKII